MGSYLQSGIGGGRRTAPGLWGLGLWGLGGGLLVLRPFGDVDRSAFGVFCQAGAGLSVHHLACVACCALGAGLVAAGTALALWGFAEAPPLRAERPRPT